MSSKASIFSKSSKASIFSKSSEATSSGQSSKLFQFSTLILAVLPLLSSCKFPGSKSKDSSSDSAPVADSLPPIEDLHHVDLDSVIMHDYQTTWRVGTCISFTATAEAYLGHTIRVSRRTPFPVTKFGSTPADVQFFASSDCSGPTVTEGVFEELTTTTTMSFRMITPGLFGANVILSGITGIPLSAIFFGPEIASYSSVHTSNTNCNRRTITLLDANGSPVVPSPTDPTSISIGEFTMPGTIKFYDSEANCLANGSTGLITVVDSGQNVTRLTLPAGVSSFDLYPQSGGTPTTTLFLVYAETLTTSTNLTTSNPSKDLVLDLY